MVALTTTLLMVMVSTTVWPTASLITNSDVINTFLDEYTKVSVDLQNKLAEANWLAATNITDYNSEQAQKLSIKSAAYFQEKAKNATKYDVTGESEDIQRQFLFMKDIGTAAETNVTKYARLNGVISKMESIYAKAKVCRGDNDCLSLEPELTKIMSNSKNYTELTNMWQDWRDVSGKKMRKLYEEYVVLNNDAIRNLGYNDTGEYWKSSYETINFEEDILRLYKEVQPLYEKLHAYARKKLKKVFGKENFPTSGHIPAHLLGNMWGQTWENRIDLLRPFMNKSSLDITDTLKEQNFTVTKMFKTAEEFFTSIGLKSMPPDFWNKSMFVRPEDGRDVVCHASAWDFTKDSDVRIKMCTVITHTDFMTVHHEMGHIEYYLLYEKQPVLYRTGANPGFHEAVGDTISLSVQTPEHLKTIGILKEIPDDPETDLNFLMGMAFRKVAFLPFGYLIDLWRWSVFRGDTTQDNYNRDWWRLRCKFQGLSPPVSRDETDFDPGAKYHVAADVPYIRYFVSFIIQFQFHKAACDATGYKGPLHRCDIYRNKAAGKKLSDMLSMGASKSWQDAMEVMTGQKKMSGHALVEYFKPLMDFLDKETEGEQIGWLDTCDGISGPDVPKRPTDVNSGADSRLNFSIFVTFTHVISLMIHFISFENL